jgi:hypothetical protein
MTCTLFKLIFIDLRREHTLFTDFSLIIFLTPFFSIVSDLAFPFPLRRRRVETPKPKPHSAIRSRRHRPSSLISQNRILSFQFVLGVASPLLIDLHSWICG